MEIIEYEALHLKALEDIYFNARRDAFFWMDTTGFRHSDFSKDTQGERIWVAIEGDALLGFIAVWQADYFIHHLYVDKSAYRQGVGMTLINKVRQVYKKPLGLKCLCKNERAISFYQAQGFSVLERGKDSLGEYYFMSLSE